MSHVSETPPPAALSEGHPVTNLTLVVLLLIPCVVILLLLNCLLLGYKFITMSHRHRAQDPEDLLLQSRVAPDTSLHPARRVYVSVSEPVLHPHPVTSSRASSRERAVLGHRIRLLRPDGATGSGSLRAPSTIRARSFSPRLDLASGSRTHSVGKRGWCRSAPVLAQSSDSEAETRVNLVPPNSPMPEMEHVEYMCRSSECKMLPDVKPAVFDKVNMECDFNNLPSETSAVGPGLDSDFGASAGVSLRILSADSDGLSNGVLNSALEWDYYDPCYVKQNNLPRHKHHRPAVHSKQYWV